MFEITPFRFAIGRGWFEDSVGFTLELDVIHVNIERKRPPRYLHGSLLAFYLETWKDDDGEWDKDWGWDFCYIKQFIDRRKKDVH